MRVITVREMRAALTRLDELLAREGELVITRRGRPIARLLPARPAAGAGAPPMPSHAGFRARMPRLAVGSEALIRADRDER